MPPPSPTGCGLPNQLAGRAVDASDLVRISHFVVYCEETKLVREAAADIADEWPVVATFLDFLGNLDLVSADTIDERIAVELN
jgi:hypothetical protein